MQITCPKCRENNSDMSVFCHLKSVVIDPAFAIQFYCENDHIVELVFEMNNGETNLSLRST